MRRERYPLLLQATTSKMTRLGSKGYTLIEMLLVLSVFMMLTSLGFGMFPPFVKKLDTSFFLIQLSDDLYRSQEYAISNQLYVTFTFDLKKGRYLANTGTSAEHILERKVPEEISFNGGVLGQGVVFTPNGNISKGGTWLIQTNEKLYKIIFNLGSGRFRIE